MSTVTVPANAREALEMLESAAGFLADLRRGRYAGRGAGRVPARPGARRRDQAAARGRFLAAFDVQGRAPGRRAAEHPQLAGPLDPGDPRAGRRAPGGAGAGRVPRAAAGRAARRLGDHHVGRAAAGQVDRRDPARSSGSRPRRSSIAAARAGAGLRELAAICAEIRYRTAPPDPDGDDDPRLGRALFLDTTLDGAGVLRGDLTPECAAMVQAVLDALSAPVRRRGPADSCPAVPRRA